METKFDMSLAKSHDARDIHNLMVKVYEDMSDKTRFFCDNLEYVEEHIEKSGFAVKAECEGKLVASLIVRFPHNAEDNLGRDAGIEKLDKVAHIESVVVDSEYRGYGLQQALMQYAEEEIDNRGYTYLMATVSPDNKHGLANFEKAGYKVVKLTEKYGGLKRAVLLKDKLGE